ncbi:MAG: thioredoxin [Calditrichaeota bacterium]|nr:thioredoxin [Calditrichota bacterium]
MGWLGKVFGGDKEGKLSEVDEATFRETVLESDLPVAVDFWASWCAPCQVMGGLLRELAPEFEGRLKIVKLNVDYSPDIARTYGIHSIPTIIVFKNGKVADQLTGLMQMNPLRQRFERHALPKPKEVS